MKGLTPPRMNSQLETEQESGRCAPTDENHSMKVRILPTTPKVLLNPLHQKQRALRASGETAETRQFQKLIQTNDHIVGSNPTLPTRKQLACRLTTPVTYTEASQV